MYRFHSLIAAVRFKINLKPPILKPAKLAYLRCNGSFASLFAVFESLNSTKPQMPRPRMARAVWILLLITKRSITWVKRSSLINYRDASMSQTGWKFAKMWQLLFAKLIRAIRIKLYPKLRYVGFCGFVELRLLAQ